MLIQNFKIDNAHRALTSFVNVKKFMRITTSISSLSRKFIVPDIKTNKNQIRMEKKNEKKEVIIRELRALQFEI